MADNGRARLGEVEGYFSRLAPGPAGREIRTVAGGSRASEPRVDASPFDYRSSPAQPAGSYFGLGEFYGRPQEPWGGDSVGLTATEPENRRYTELLDGPPAALRSEGPYVGSWSDIFADLSVPAPAPTSDLGGNDQVDWISSLLVGAVAAVAFCWGVAQRHKVATALWAAVVVAWVVPMVIR